MERRNGKDSWRMGNDKVINEGRSGERGREMRNDSL